MEQGVIETGSKFKRECKPNRIILDFNLRYTGRSEGEAKSLTEVGIKAFKDFIDEYFADMPHTVYDVDYYVHYFSDQGDGKEYECDFIFTFDIMFGNYDQLNKVERFIQHYSNVDFVRNITCRYGLEDKRGFEDALKAEMIKECKEEANTVLSEIGYKVVGIKSINCSIYDESIPDGINEEAFIVRNKGDLCRKTKRHKIVVAGSVNCVFYIGEEINI